jgi:hypothetical protein
VENKEIIEEMTKDLKENLSLCADVKLLDHQVETIAYELLKKYQPKLPKDSVVLSREEYEKYKIIEYMGKKSTTIPAYKLIKTFRDIEEQASKETAEKIYSLYAKRVDQIILELKASFNTTTFNNDFEKTIKESLANTQIETLILTKNGVKEFVEQFGVEIKE